MFSDDPEWDLAILSYIHDQIIEASGGSKGFHNEGLIKSALARPNHSVMGMDAYNNVFAKAAALLDAIARNHGFRDGNKIVKNPILAPLRMRNCETRIATVVALCHV